MNLPNKLTNHPNRIKIKMVSIALTSAHKFVDIVSIKKNIQMILIALFKGGCIKIEVSNLVWHLKLVRGWMLEWMC